MKESLRQFILQATGASDVFEQDHVQSLWSGYGRIVRMGLQGADQQSVIVKHICLNQDQGHPRGWNTDLSHQRKLKSYDVETHWYDHWSKLCDEVCRVPQCLASTTVDGDIIIILEDLDAAGFALRHSSVSLQQIHLCLRWLAYFHATFMGQTPEGLWPVGTYWHLETRPDELAALDDIHLKKSASRIDQKLNQCHYQTFVHGDAKLANFCFRTDDHNVAAVDFQYVGGGCGMKDVAYFIGSCLHEEECHEHVPSLLDVYFQCLREALTDKNFAGDASALESEWRDLFPFAWTDFHRFIKGWSPGHWKINSYSEEVARQTLEKLCS